MRLRPISPRDWAALRNALRRDALNFGALGALFLGAALLEPYSTTQPYSGEAKVDVQPDHLDLRERLGYATLLEADYADVELVDDEADSVYGNAYLEFAARTHPDLECLARRNDSTASGVKVDTYGLAKAVVAAERYNRGDFERRAELTLASLILRSRGRLPEFSLGVGQIRPATARRMVSIQLRGTTVPDSDILVLLRDACQNARLAGLYLSELISQEKDAQDEISAVESVARTYNGANRALRNGTRYTDAVAGAYMLLKRSESFEADADAETLADSTILAGADSAGTARTRIIEFASCRRFEFGEVKAYDTTDVELDPPDASPVDTATLRLVRPVASVTVQLHQVESGPASYRQRLGELRRAWVVEWLEAQGFRRDWIRVDETGRPRRCADWGAATGVESEIYIHARSESPVR